MEKGFDSELMYGEKHLRTKKKPMMVKYNAKRRYTLCLFVIDISRLCFQDRQKLLSTSVNMLGKRKR